MKEVIEEAVKLSKEGQPCVLATVVRTKGSTPQKAGAMLLVREDGTGVGTLGGGCVEGDIWFAAKEILRQHGGPEFKDYYLNADNVPTGSANPVKLGAKLLLRLDGSVVGTLGDAQLDEKAKEVARQVAEVGNTESFNTDSGAEIFVEGFTTPPTLVMVGGGHVGKATADLAHSLGYRVYVVDDRPEFCNQERFPNAEQTVVTPYGAWADHVTINVNSFVVVATRGHRFDDMALESALATKARYIGLLGSRRKTIMIYRRLIEQGTPVDRLRDVHAPIGLDIGGLTPEELAVSIMSEIIMVRRGGKGGPMGMDEWFIERAAKIAERAVEV